MMPSIEKEVCSVWKDQPLQRGLQKWQNKTLHNINQETDQYQKEDDIDMVNINSINCNSKCSVITVNFKTSSNQAKVIVLYKVGTGSDGNIIPLHI